LHNVAQDFSPLLWHCNQTYIYTNLNRTTCIHASMINLGWKVEEGCSYYLIMVLALQCSQFLHHKINVITLLTHLIAPPLPQH
jgi:hypothetical protein